MSKDTAREQIEILRIIRERQVGAARAAPARVRRIFMGMGDKWLAPGDRAWWSSPPVESALKVERVLLTIQDKGDFAVNFYGWRSAGLVLDFGIPQEFSRTSGGLWLHPYHYGAHLEPGKVLELELENLGKKTIRARAGLIGIALCEPPAFDVTETKGKG